ncbi:hypothetical protein [Clostridium sardiniense]|uniref:hypothetical protein n=1 Tax=Clostridium sardiniense TaxID=29369 RepID=UPI003D32D01B
MKKYNANILLFIFLFSIISIITLSILSYLKFPYNHPELKVSSSSDDTEFYAETNGGNWFDSSNGQGGNSFDLGTYDLERLSEIGYSTVSCNTDIKLDLSFTKDIETFKVYSINENIKSNEDHKEVEMSNYTITAPKKPGTYGYVVETIWDDTHNVRFIFKIKTV